jgi:lipopolysaccharide export system permease protein
MRLLDRYLLRELLIPLGFCLCGFLVFWIAFDLIGRMGEYQDKGMQAGELVEYYLAKIPEFLVLILPMVLLLALLYTLTNHARHNELTAIRAAGLSLWRICVPYVAVGFGLTVLLFALSEYCVPGCSALAEDILSRHRKADAPDPDLVKDLGLKNDRDGRTWVMESYDLKAGTMERVRVTWNEPGGARCQLMANRAEYRNGSWVFLGAQEWRKDPDAMGQKVADTNELAMPQFSETPSVFRRQYQFSRWFMQKHDAVQSVTIPLGDILDYLDLHPDLTARNRWQLYTQIHEQLAAPWTCLVVVLIAIPFGAPSGRRNVFVGVASSIGIVFAYYVLQQVALSAGISGRAPAWVAAWLPNLCFGLWGLWMMARVR